jgi:hypothetical protein
MAPVVIFFISFMLFIYYSVFLYRSTARFQIDRFKTKQEFWLSLISGYMLFLTIYKNYKSLE